MLSFPVLPMKATLRSSSQRIPPGEDWAFEIKWDGHRTLAHIVEGDVTFQTTSGLDSTPRWPDVTGLASAVGTNAILDGEMVVIGDDGRPSFDLTQGRSDPSRHRAVFQIFDVLQIGDSPSIEVPYVDRRSLLDRLIEPSDNWQVPGFHVGGGDELLAATVEQGLEGIIAKRLGSSYRPGTRSKDWLKIKNRRRVELVVGGFTEGEGNRAGTFGSLVVGIDEQAATDPEVARALGEPLGAGTVRFAGGVGTGFDTSTLRTLTDLLTPLVIADSPFDAVNAIPAIVRRSNPRWVRPEVRIVVDLAEFTNYGHVRHASFVSLA